MKSKGKISITRPHYSDDREFVEIAIKDDISGVEFATVYIGLADFSRALTGLGHVECEFEHRPTLVGKKYEHKTEPVPRVEGYMKSAAERQAVAKKAFAPFEIDGWKGRVDDLFNSHCANRDGTYNVVFTRYVDVKGEQG